MTTQRFSQGYLDYLASPEWRETKKQAIRLAGFKCEDCARRDVPLDVHHLTYVDFGHEQPHQLLSLCRKCHNRRHGKNQHSMFWNAFVVVTGLVLLVIFGLVLIAVLNAIA